MIKAIFFDVDGTLLSFKTHKISEHNFSILRQLKDKGILLFVASGRNMNGLKPLLDFPFDGYIINNGQCYLDASRNIFYENSINKEDLEIILEEVNREPFPCAFTLRNNRIFNYRDERVDYIHNLTQADGDPEGDISNLASESVYQVMCFIDEDREKDLCSKLKYSTSSRWHETFCDINPIGGDKGIAVKAFLDKFGIKKEETMAFGDGGNDSIMLESVGIGIAMGNAGEECKAIADYITDSVDDNGIENACKHFNLI